MRSDSWRIVATYSTEDVWTVGWGTIREHALSAECPLYPTKCKVLLLRDSGLPLVSLNIRMLLLSSIIHISLFYFFGEGISKAITRRVSFDFVVFFLCMCIYTETSINCISISLR